MNRLLALCLLALAGCTYTYLPPLREAQMPEPIFSVSASSELLREATSLKLRLRVATVPEAGWVAVQWFDPRNREVASESVWFEANSNPQVVDLPLPDDIPLSPGLWRAVVSYGGKLARQFSVEVP